MGQNLFSPPNVKGWPGGETWINTNTLLARKQFLERLARVDAPAVMRTSIATNDSMSSIVATDDVRERGARFGRAIERGMRELAFDVRAWEQALPGDTPAERYRFARLLLIPIETAGSPDDGTLGTAALRALLQDNAFQLK